MGKGMTTMSNSPLVVYTKLSPNHSGKRNHSIDTITIHCVAGNATVEAVGNLFANPERGASSNYGIGGDGRIALYVDEANRSWCTSSGSNDHRAITIEVANTVAKDPWPVSDKAYAALIELVTDICKRNGIKKLVWSTNKNDRVNHLNGCNMTVHRDYANKACPGDYLYNRHGAIAEAVNKKLGAVPDTPVVSTLYYVQTGAFSVKANADAHMAKVKAKGFEAILKLADGLYKVQTGAYSVKANADAMATKLKAAGFATYITTKGGNVVSNSAAKSVDELAREVLAGKWGNGDARKQRLTAAGYDYDAVQKRVNELAG